MRTHSSKDIKLLLGCPDRISDPDYQIDQYAIDSRSVVSPQNTLFFAISTPNNNGHDFIPELYKKGVRNFVVTEPQNGFEDANFYRVDNTVAALQKIASDSIKNDGGTIIAITGSRGKTVVKEWLNILLNPGSQRSPRSFNSQIGVAISMLDSISGIDFSIYETGISLKGEMERIREILNPTVGLLTCITDEHSDGFNSRLEKIREKLILFKNCRQVITPYFNNDDELNNEIKSAVSSDRLIQWSYPDGPDTFLKIISIDKSEEMTTVGIRYKGNVTSLTLPFTSDIEIEEAMTAITAAIAIKGEIDFSKTNLFHPIATRIEVITGRDGSIILRDRFTNDLSSLYGALDFAKRRVTTNRSLMLIAHTSLDCGEVRSIAEEYGVESMLFTPSYAQFLKNYDHRKFTGKVILVKETPSGEMNGIVSMLEQKQHETILEINLDNLVHNFNFFRGKVGHDTGIVVMLKANGYGCGSLELAKTLERQGAAAIAVAVIDEGVELRNAGVEMPIIVLNPRADNYGLMFTYRLEPEVYSFDILNKIAREAKTAGITGFPIHIKLDTGMHRLGFGQNDLNRLSIELSGMKELCVSSVFTHLATADCFDMDEYTGMQLSLFDNWVSFLRTELKEPFKAHVLNTAGILRYSTTRNDDLVRLGIGLYGLPVLNDGSENALRPVAALYSTIISIADRNNGDSIGYSRRGRVTHNSRIATVPVGYADGIDRRLGNGNTSFFVNGHRCPTIGNICMDICMIDVTDVDCSVGDKVEIFGPNISICEISNNLGTIPYEILTSTSERVKRVYYRE